MSTASRCSCEFTVARVGCEVRGPVGVCNCGTKQGLSTAEIMSCRLACRSRPLNTSYPPFLPRPFHRRDLLTEKHRDIIRCKGVLAVHVSSHLGASSARPRPCFAEPPPSLFTLPAPNRPFNRPSSQPSTHPTDHPIQSKPTRATATSASSLRESPARSATARPTAPGRPARRWSTRSCSSGAGWTATR